MAAGLAQAQPGDAGPGGGADRFGDRGQGGDRMDRVVVESLDAEQAPVGGEADLPQRGQIRQPFPDSEVAGVVDGGLGPQRTSFLVVLLDRGVLVVHVQTRGDSLGDDPGPEPARGGLLAATEDAPVEDQADLGTRTCRGWTSRGVSARTT